MKWGQIVKCLARLGAEQASSLPEGFSNRVVIVLRNSQRQERGTSTGAGASVAATANARGAVVERPGQGAAGEASAV